MGRLRGTRILLLALISGIIASVLFLSFRESPESIEPSPLALEGRTMGTRYRLLIHPGALVNDSPARASFAAAVQSALDTLDRGLFSTYSASSQLSRLNALAPGMTMTVDRALLDVLKAAEVVHQQSGGAFDISIKPLVDLWGFGATGPQAGIPDSKAIARARAMTGMEKIVLQHDAGSVLKSANVTLDLSAIAKGYAVDEIGRLLESRGIEDYLLEIGGEVLVRGRRPDGAPWRVGIELPAAGEPELFQPLVMASKQLGIATSGDYHNFFMHDGRRYSHTLDPQTGWPVDQGLASVTVVGESVMQADAWATALMVLGADEGMKIANQLQLAVYFIVANETGGFSSRHSAAFTQYLGSL